MTISLERSTLLTIFYITLLDYVGGLAPIYIGRATAGAATSDPAWQIQRMTYDANNNPLNVLFANGTNGFTNVWDRRTQYTYS